MTPLRKGMFIRSTEALAGDFFAGAIIFLTEFNSAGAIGFVINKRFSRSLNELVEFRDSPAFPLYDGGPVDKQHLFFVHRRPDLIGDGTEVTGSIFSGGNFTQAVEAINRKTLTSASIKIFVGYCGWDPGELEAELEEGSWELVDADPDAVFQ